MACGQQSCYECLRSISNFLLLLTLIVTMIALCSSNWYSGVNILKRHDSNDTNETTYVGLWNICTGKPELVDYCVFLPPPERSVEWNYRISEEHLTAVRALYSMSVLLLFGALGYPPFFKQMSTDMLKIGFMAVLTAAGGICSFACMLVMTHDINTLPHKVKFGYTYIIGWCGTGLAFITASVIYIASKDNVYVEKNFN